MLKSLVKAIWVVVCLALPCTAYAVGMGSINVSSALGEPLKAEIDLVAISKAEKGRLIARLASPEAFKSAGMNYPADLSKLKFQIETRANGEPYLKLTTAQPLNEPFLSLLIELSWPSGKLLREYTFLLDPPEFKAKQPEAAEVKPVAPVAESPVKQEPAALQPPPAAPQEEKAPAAIPAPAPAAAEPPVAVAPLPAEKPAEPAAAATSTPAPAVPGTVEVKHGDILGQIALNSRPSGVSLERMLLALYRANTEAFDGNNMNRLKAGKILRVPEQDEINQVTQAEAAEEFRAHVANWNEYRQKLAAASSTATEQPAKQEASGKISTTIADKSTAAKEPPKEVVKLSKGETPGDKTVTSGNAKALQEKINTLEEEAVAKEMALKASNERVVLLEKNIKEMQRLIELKGQPPATPAKPAQAKTGEQAAAKPEAKAEPSKAEPKKTEAQKEEAKPAAPAPVAASQPPAASAVAVAASEAKPAKPASKPTPKPVPVAPPPPSFVDELMDNPALLAGGAAALLALGGLGIMAARRRKGATPGKGKGPGIAEAAAAAGIAEATTEAVAAPSPETGDFTHDAAPQSEEVDPISEADLFLNFGRDVQAEEILKDALSKNPASNPIRLKLLSIYANRKDTNSFSVIARQVESSGDAEAWAQAAEMGRNIDPANPMYGGSAEPPATPASEPQPVSGLDFDLGLGEQEAPAESAAADETTSQKSLESTFTGLDFDLGVAEPEQPAPAKNKADGAPDATEILSHEELEAAQQTPTDFDVSGSYTAPTAEAGKNTLDDLVFDVTGSHPDVDTTTDEKNVAEAASPDNNEESGLSFTLDIPTETQPEAAPSAAKESMDFDLSSINLDVEIPGAAPAAETPSAEPKDAHWHDVATKLDLARAYQEMGDNAGAREILEEVIAEGDEQQRAAAEAIKQQLLV